jgi:hypothetical protein
VLHLPSRQHNAPNDGTLEQSTFCLTQKAPEPIELQGFSSFSNESVGQTEDELALP